jgi:DNA-binding transcriptional ArsR family regulator
MRQQRRRRVQSRKCHSARRYGRERALLGRSLLNFMRIARDAHTPDLTLGEVGDLLFTAIEVFIGHAFGRPMVISELSRNLEMPRDAVRRKLQRLLEIGLVERIDHHYYMTAKANTPLQREVLLAHLRNMQSAITEVTKMDPAGLQR